MDKKNHSIRYLFEFNLLPEIFYKNKASFINTILDDDNAIYKAINHIYEEEKAQNPYTKEQFKAEGSKILDNVFVVEITFPKPEDEPLCHKVYLFFDESFSKMKYYTIERGNNIISNEEITFICSVAEDGSHENFAQTEFDETENLKFCAYHFLKTQLNFSFSDEE